MRRINFFQADLNGAGYVSHVIAFAQMRRAVCQRQLSFLFGYAADRQTQDDNTVKPWRIQLFQNRLESITDFSVLILILHCIAPSM